MSDIQAKTENLQAGAAAEKHQENMSQLIAKLFDGDELPAYLKVTLSNNKVTLLLDLGTETTEAVRRLEEVNAMNYKNLVISKLEVDGPRYLQWEKFTDTIMRLLFVQKIPDLAVPEGQVNGVKGRLAGLVLSTLRARRDADPLKICGISIPLRSVINTNTVTARVSALSYSPIEEEVKRVEALLKSYHNEGFVPVALRRLLCQVHKVGKRNYRNDKRRRKAGFVQPAASRPSGDDQMSDTSSISCHDQDGDLSDASDESTGFVVSCQQEESAASDAVPNSSVERPQNNDNSDNQEVPKAGSSKYDLHQNPPELGSVRCYVCIQKWIPLKCPTDAVRHYPRLCPPCAEVNWSKRNRTVDLTGYIAVVTGGRIKIGYDVVLKLLRNGCQVVTTSRFPHDAARRFAAETDHDEWSERLQIYPLELKDAKAIYKFIEHLKQKLPYVDILVNNAAQTLRRPLSFYEHLIDHEQMPHSQLPAPQRRLLATQQSLVYQNLSTESMVASSNINDNPTPAIVNIEHESTDKKRPHSETPEENSASKKPRIDLSESEVKISEGSTEVRVVKSEEGYFPAGLRDEFGQQVDLRPTNSWESVLEEVAISELLEVMMVNTIAPYILNKELKALLMASPHKRRFIVNISAMEGQFRRAAKTRHHPHTNMSKAALNMMTRTGALGYREDHIYMTSVDTGWVSDQRPFAKAAREKDKKGFVLPLDCVDAAARTLDPVFSGIEQEKEPYYAVYLKNFKPFPW